MCIWAVRSIFKPVRSAATSSSNVGGASEVDSARPRKSETKTASLFLLLHMASSIFRIAAHNLEWLIPARCSLLYLSRDHHILSERLPCMRMFSSYSFSIVALWSSKSSSRWISYASRQISTQVFTLRFVIAPLLLILRLQPAVCVMLEALVDCVNSHPFPPSPALASLPEDSHAIG
jgi:hypothetical protein